MARLRRGVAAAAVLALGVVPVAHASGVASTTECETPNGGDRATSVLAPDSTANQVSVWLSADAGPDEVGAHVEPWRRDAYFVDAAVRTDGSAAVNTSVDGGDGEGPSYGRVHVGPDGACAASATAGIGAAVTGDQTVVAGPGAVSAGYATRLVVIKQGAGLDFANADLSQHDVRSYADDTEGEPLFASDMIGTVATAPVLGVATLAPGSYPFYCSAHANMNGTLTVQGAP